MTTQPTPRLARCPTAAWAAPFLVAGLAAALPAGAAGLPGMQGDRIVNVARVTASELPEGVASGAATIAVRIPSRAAIELMAYSPGAAGAWPGQVELGACRSGPAPADPFVAQAAPWLTGSAAPLALARALPLVPAPLLHQNDPLFVRVTDPDQNLDRAVRETLLVTFTDDLTGDVEVVRLTEDGADSGVFVGYVQSAGVTSSGGPPGRSHDGRLQVAGQSRVTGRYVDAQDGSDAVAAAVLVDPFGLVFDSRSGLPVSGAAVSVLVHATGQPAAVLADDGVTSYPATVVSGQPVTDGAGRVTAQPPGQFRFPFLRPGTYRFQVRPPAGYGAPSTATDAELAALAGAPFAVVPGSRGEPFVVAAAPPVVRIDVPVDPGAGSLWVQKTAGRDRVGLGDLVAYDIAVTNRAADAAEVQVVDALPVGFRYQPGSARWNGAPVVEPVVSADGRTLTFEVGTLLPAASGTLRFAARVGAGAVVNAEAVNRAWARSPAGATSNVARAGVKVVDDLLTSRGVIVGRVERGPCREPADGQARADEPAGSSTGVEGARVFLEDGTFATADQRGLFHFEAVRPGLHVVQLDLGSLPPGLEAISCVPNDRFAGRAFSQFVEVQGGGLWRADFRVSARPAGAPGAGAPPAAATAGPAAAAADTKPAARPASAPPAPVPADSGAGQGATRAAPPTGAAGPPGAGEAPHAIEAAASAGTAASAGPAAGSEEAAGVVRGAEPEEAARSGGVAVRLTQRLDGQGVEFHVEVSGAGPVPPGTTVEVRLPEGLSYLPESSTVDGRPVRDPGQDGDRLVYPLDATVGGDWKRVLLLRAKAAPGGGRSVATVWANALVPGSGEAGAGCTEPVIQPAEPCQERPPTRLRVRVHFPPLGAELSAKERAMLDGLAGALGQVKPAQVTVTGHADALPVWRGPYRDNLELSQARAASVGGYLTSVLQIPADRVVAVGKGEADPIGSNATLAGRAQNRRAELVVEGTSQACPAVPAPVDQGPTSTSPPTPAATPAATPEGLLSHSDGDLVPDRIGAVQVQFPSGLTPTLLVDGKEVDASRIGYRRVDPGTGLTTLTYVGVDLGEKGSHALTLEAKDPFGNVRLRRTAALTRTGEIAAIRVRAAEGNVADAATPVRLRLELLDAAGDVIRGSARLEVREGTLQPLRREGERLTLDTSTARQVVVDKDGWALFQPVGASGSYRVVLGLGSASVEAETWVEPVLRDWILVGLAEGTAGQALASGNLETLRAGDAPEDLYADGRLAFYAKGRLPGKWLLTMAADTARRSPEGGQALFQTVDPEASYTLYGDAGRQAPDAPTTGKLYVKLEREQFYALFGDHDTGLTVTELSRYSRKLTGLKAELQGRYLEVNAFGARTGQAFTRDELPGDGTSGLYQLSRRDVLAGSETVTVVARDRFRSELVVSRKAMARFVDYSIDTEAGTLFFREPIPSRDPELNPITIVVEYETTGGSQELTGGGRAGVKLPLLGLRAGVTAVHEGLGDRASDLYGADLRLELSPDTKLRGELAYTDSRGGATSRTGTAHLIELSHTSRAFDLKLHQREQEAGFGLGQQAGTETATRKMGLEGAYRFGDHLGVTAQAFRQESLGQGTERRVAEARLEYKAGGQAAWLGARSATDVTADGAHHASGQLTAGGKVLTLRERLTVGLDYAQSVWGNGSADYPTRLALSGELKLAPGAALVGTEELTWGAAARTQNTRLGLRLTPWTGGAFTTSADRQASENGQRLLGTMGLRQAWKLSEAWKLDLGAERSQTLLEDGASSVNPAVPPASGTVVPPPPGGSLRFSAASVGATYEAARFVWNGRAEARVGDAETRWTLTTGAVAELRSGWAWSGRGQLMASTARGGADSTSVNLRAGLVHRPAQASWILLDRLDWYLERRSGTGPGLDTQRLVNNLLASWQPRRDLQLSLGYGAKLVRERLTGGAVLAFTDQVSVEGRHDLSPRWDVGGRLSAVHTWGGGEVAYSGGPSVGCSPAPNVWLSLGYNVVGYTDGDFSAAGYTAAGPYLRFRMKFDQQSVREAAAWLNGP